MPQTRRFGTRHCENNILQLDKKSPHLKSLSPEEKNDLELLKRFGVLAEGEIRLLEGKKLISEQDRWDGSIELLRVAENLLRACEQLRSASQGESNKVRGVPGKNFVLYGQT